MDYIEKLKQQHVKFQLIDEIDAKAIMKNEYSYYKLISYAEVFDKYRKGENVGLFVDLEFAQLYYLAKIDYHIQCALMGMFLRIEEGLKARLLYDIESSPNSENFIEEYYSFDREYLEKTYVATNNDAIKNHDDCQSILDLKINDFFDVIQFGTLQRVMIYFYDRYAYNIDNLETLKIRLESVRKIRNIIAHNNSVVNKLNVKTDYKDLKVLSYLGRCGIKKRTLHTNMSKMIINDLCGFFDIYFMINHGCEDEKGLNELDSLIQSYKHLFIKNDTLMTSYVFLKQVYNVYRNKY